MALPTRRARDVTPAFPRIINVNNFFVLSLVLKYCNHEFLFKNASDFIESNDLKHETTAWNI